MTGGDDREVLLLLVTRKLILVANSLWNSQEADFSVVLFRSDFVLLSEQNYMKVLKNQWLLAVLYSSECLAGAPHRGHTMAPEGQRPAQ